jgi:hypothetical protein
MRTIARMLASRLPVLRVRSPDLFVLWSLTGQGFGSGQGKVGQGRGWVADGDGSCQTRPIKIIRSDGKPTSSFEDWKLSLLPRVSGK